MRKSIIGLAVVLALSGCNNDEVKSTPNDDVIAVSSIPQLDFFLSGYSTGLKVNKNYPSDKYFNMYTERVSGFREERPNSYQSSDENVISVNGDILSTGLTNLKLGKDGIYADSNYPVEVIAAEVESISLSANSRTAHIGQSVDLNVLYNFDNKSSSKVDNSKVEYTISDPNVASLDGSKLTAIAQGTTDIVVSVNGIVSNNISLEVLESNYTGEFEIDVSENERLEKSLYSNPSAVPNVRAILTIYNEQILADEEVAIDVSNDVVWNVKDESILKIEDGIFVPQSMGLTRVSATFNGMETYTFYVHVVARDLNGIYTNHSEIELEVNEFYTLKDTTRAIFEQGGSASIGELVHYEIVSGDSVALDSKNSQIYGLQTGQTILKNTFLGFEGELITIDVVEPPAEAKNFQISGGGEYILRQNPYINYSTSYIINEGESDEKTINLSDKMAWYAEPSSVILDINNNTAYIPDSVDSFNVYARLDDKVVGPVSTTVLTSLVACDSNLDPKDGSLKYNGIGKGDAGSGWADPFYLDSTENCLKVLETSGTVDNPGDLMTGPPTSALLDAIGFTVDPKGLLTKSYYGSRTINDIDYALFTHNGPGANPEVTWENGQANQWCNYLSSIAFEGRTDWFIPVTTYGTFDLTGDVTKYGWEAGAFYWVAPNTPSRNKRVHSLKNNISDLNLFDTGQFVTCQSAS